jgi:2-methylcitrate dehydratase
MMNPEATALARQRLLVTVATMLEALYEPTAVQVLATLRPADMRPGGARVPGTSYELPAATATRAMQQLLALGGGRADALLAALADADIEARLASLSGKTPPVLASLYPHCTAETVAPGSDTLENAMLRLYRAAEKIFTLTHMRRIDEQFHQWTAQPASIDSMPVQQFVARFIRNAPP